jgi:hypothetical protein
MPESDDSAMLARAKPNFARFATINFQAATQVNCNNMGPIQPCAFMDFSVAKKTAYLKDPKHFTADYNALLQLMEDNEKDPNFLKVITEARKKGAADQLADAAIFLLAPEHHNGSSTIYNTMDWLDHHPDVATDGQDRRNQPPFGGMITTLGFFNCSEEHSKCTPVTCWESTSAVVTRRQLTDHALNVKVRGKEHPVKCLPFCITMLLAQDIRSYSTDYQAIRDSLSDLINRGILPVSAVNGKNDLPLGMRIGGAAWSPRYQDVVDMLHRVKLPNGLKDMTFAPDGRSHTQMGHGTRGSCGLTVITAISQSRDSRIAFGGPNMQGSGNANSHTHYLNPYSATTGDTMREYPAITPILMALITKFARTHSAAGYVPTDATQSQFSTSTFANSQGAAPTREQGVALAVAQAPRAPSKKRKVAPVLLLDDETEEGSKRTSTASRQLLAITATAPNGSSVGNFADLT